ncbi:26S proteasome non-ATPase regulatory subunit 10 [Talaromyces pinophilus]|nr:26S proteasome non-ATPase regulatory subunit 10 [Talaromyces pinophilus]
MSKESTVDAEMSLEEAAKLPDPAIFESKLKELMEQEQVSKKVTKELLLWQSAYNGDVAVATKLLQKGADIDTRQDSSGWTPLYIAVQKHRTAMVKLLLEHGAKPDVKCNLGLRTPLHQAAEAGDEEIVKLLLTHKANPNLYNDNKRRPLVFAAAEGHLAVVKMLLDHGALPQTKEDPQTPLYWAKRHEYEDIVQLLEPLCKEEPEPESVEDTGVQRTSDSGRCLVQ